MFINNIDMRSANFYSRLLFRGKNAKGHGFVRTFLLAGLLMIMLPFAGWANVPIFTSGPFQTHTICGGIPTSLNTWLAVNDPSLGNTDTWSITINTTSGTLGGFPTTVPSGTIGIPSGLTYTPDPGATGDNFTITVDDGTGNSASVSIVLIINPGLSLTLGTINPVCAGASSAVLPFTSLTNVGPDTAVFSYTGVPQTFTVPANVTNVKFDLMGASGGNDDLTSSPNPGKGGRIQGTLSVTPFQALNIYVGGRGGDGNFSGAVGGYNGGGNAQFYFFGSGGAGGGATDIRIGGTTLGNRKVVAGGGGGNGANDPSEPLAGGAGGGTIGGNSANIPGGGTSHANGGTQSGGGAPATYFTASGGFGSLGNGGAGSSTGISGGGGGGYFGGGGGVWTGGGGGSSFADNLLTTAVVHTQGANTGDGVANIYYTLPGTYTIIWDATANGQGFNNVANVVLPTSSQFNIDVPTAAAPGTYNGTLTINNSSCTSPAYPFTITIKSIPTVALPANQVICNGDSTADIPLSTSVSGGSVIWTNDNTSIGLGASGSGHIPGFVPVNTTPNPVIANITIRPFANGCIGDSQTFHITDNPIPALNSTATPTRLCNNDLFSYIPNSLTTGTNFAWSRVTITGIANAAASGSDNPNENLVNTSTDPVNVVYQYILSANGCLDTTNVTVQVNPTAVLTSTLTPAAVCNNTLFSYAASSSTAAAVLNWNRATVSGISNPAGSGVGTISETLVNTTNVPKTANYVFSMDVNGCITTQNVPVTVSPTPALTSPLTLTPNCSGQTFSYTPTTGVTGTVINWSRPLAAGISPATNSGSDGFSEVLTNTTPDPKVASYIYTMSAFGCSYTQTVSVTVKPMPTLTSTLTPDSICTNTMFNYNPTSATPGTTFQWVCDNQIGISNPPVTGINSAHEILYDTTELPVNVKFIYVLTANGCLDSQNVIVRVNPLPKLSNDVSALAICDSTKFSFNPTSNTPGATFAWTRAYQPGVSNLQATGTNNPNETLNNTTYITVDVPYMYVISAAGCTNTQSISVSVRPSPILSTSNTANACTSVPFTYVPISYTPSTSYAWSRASVAGITPATASGTGNITDTMTQTTSGPVTVVYVYTLTVTGTTCSNTQKVTVTVNPGPPAPVIGTHPASSLCGNSSYVNFGADAPAASGLTYYWTASNATIVSTGSDKQYCLVNFYAAGTATVTLTSKIANTTCISSTSYTVNVGNGTVSPAPEIIYFDGQFICRQTQESSYQWGYDNATTLDSTVLTGETNQNYANAFPDWNNNRYWVMTTNNGCSQKTYYNKPTGVAELNTDAAGMKVFPNPANDFINVEINSLVKGNINVEVSNMLGQKLNNVTAVDNKAQISVAGLPAGCYLVDCFSDGVKIAAARFIKN